MLFREAGDVQGLIMVLIFLSSHVRNQGDEVLGQALLAESAELVERLTHKPARALALQELGYATATAGDYPRARSLYAQSLSLNREIGDRLRLAYALTEVAGDARNHGDYEWANALAEESASLFEELRDKGGLANVLHTLGELALMQGNDARALEVESASAALYRELGNKVDMCWPQINLAYLAQHQTDYLRASALAAECLTIMVEARLAFGIAACLAALAGVAPGRLQPERAARLFGAAERVYETADLAAAPIHQIEVERNVTAARGIVDEATWQAAWAEGETMSLEHADRRCRCNETNPEENDTTTPLRTRNALLTPRYSSSSLAHALASTRKYLFFAYLTGLSAYAQDLGFGYQHPRQEI